MNSRLSNTFRVLLLDIRWRNVATALLEASRGGGGERERADRTAR